MSFGGSFGGFGQNNNNNQTNTSSTFGGFGSTNNNPTSGKWTRPRLDSGGIDWIDLQASDPATLDLVRPTRPAEAFSAATLTQTPPVASAHQVRSMPSDSAVIDARGLRNYDSWRHQSTNIGLGFGSNTTGGFGAKPTFGSTTTTGGTGLFGSPATNTTSTSGFGGGFGSNTNNTTSGFGASNTTSGGLFGANANKTGFGATGNTGGSLFGATGTTSTGFGGGFGSATNTLGSGAVGDPPGTAVSAFAAHTEKEPNSAANQSNAFQNILFQDPYKKWSGEELRLADYVQGRRHGNASGGGAFGVSSGFGGGFGSNTNTGTSAFGASTTNTGGGLFGSNTNNTTSGFGQTNTGGFGATNTNTSGGLFGNANANKPAGGLFGSTTNTQQSGGLFGGTNTGTSGFGSTNTNTGGFGATNTNTGGGLFGTNNAANKPSGFSFGQTNTNATPGFGNTTNNAFGASTTNTGGGLFGGNNNTTQQNTGGGLFGNTNQQNTGGSLFGNTNNQQSGGLFGSTQQKPAGGLFGNTTTNTTGGGLFGNANTQQNTSAFGTAANTNTGTGLFGGAKTTTGTGLFGSSTPAATNASGSGLFGGLGTNTQAQQNTGTGLFGSTNAQQQKPSLFGSTNTNTGTGLFGSTNNQNTGTGLFGMSANNQQQQNTLGGSILGNSQNSNAPQGLTANLNDVSAYGTPSLFAGIGGTEVQNPGPLATPLNGNSKPRRSSILPMYKLAPASASRFATPQKRGGYGFSYSSYGTPGGSPASSIASTPGNMGRSFLGSSQGGLSKSMSVNNLRRSFNTEDSILAPGAFSAGSQPRWYGSTGSKKLVINRDIRSDLFSTPQKDKSTDTGSRKLHKRVSFDTSNVASEDGTPVRALPAPGDIGSSPADVTPRQNRAANGSTGSKTPEMEQVNGKELTIVHEEDNTSTPEISINGLDTTPGEYWMQPPKEDLQNMNRMQRQKIADFTVGRDQVGYITFKVPVDLSNIDLEEICGNIIQLEPRSATVYPVSAKKPPVGKGLNVPARISLEHSWPRGGRDRRSTTDPKRLNKHVERLKRIENTTFESYDKDSGIWVFSVEHFTTYGLDDSDDESDVEIDNDMALVTEPEQMTMDMSPNSQMEDDTFDFRRQRGVPGTFNEQGGLYEDDFSVKPSFLGVSSADSAPNDVRLSLEEEYTADMGEEYDLSEDEDMARSSTGQHLAAELDEASSEDGQAVRNPTPGGVLRARMRAMKDSVGPIQLEVADGDDWMEMLKKTVSPVKRDRQLLRELNDSPLRQTSMLIDLGKSEEGNLRKSSVWNKSTTKSGRLDGFSASTLEMDKGRGFATSIDLMNSLFEKPKPASQNLRASVPSKGFPKVGSLVVT